MAGFDVLQPWQPMQEQGQDWESSGNVSLDNLIKQREKGNIRQRKGRLATFLKALRMLGIAGSGEMQEGPVGPRGFGGLMGQ